MAERDVISFRGNKSLVEQLQQRVGGAFAPSTHQVAERDLERYYDMLARSMPALSYGEAGLLVDIMNGSIIMPYSIPKLWAEVSDAIHEGYAEKWQVDGEKFVEKLRKLTPFECMSVGDAIERYWNGAYHKEGSIEDNLRTVGLVK